MWRMISRYWAYWWQAKTPHGVHSPFVYALLTKTILAKTPKTEVSAIERLRQELGRSTEKLLITDLGAGSTINNQRERTVGDVARNSAKSSKFGRLLYRLVQRFESQVVVEMGTSLGISTLYLAAANPEAEVVTMEGCPNTAAKAQSHFQQLNRTNIRLVEGDFAKTLDSTLQQLKQVDLFFVDGNHREEPTWEYFLKGLEVAHNETVFVFDDIHWSDGMERAWKRIQEHPAVHVTIDLFFVGLVFLREEQAEEHFVLRF